MVMDMRFLIMLPPLVILAVVMTLGKLAMVVLVRMPGGPMLKVARYRAHTAAVMMGHRIVIMTMDHRLMRMLRLISIALCALPSRLRRHVGLLPIRPCNMGMPL